MPKKLPNAAAVIKGDQTTYVERSDSAKREEVKILLTEAIADFDDGVKEIADGGKAIIRGCNKIRESGRKIEQAEQVGQFEFNLFSTDIEGWAKETERKQKMKTAKKIYHLLKDKKAETLEDCQLVMHQLFVMAGMVKEARRIGGEISHETPNPFTHFIDAAAKVESWLKKWEPEESPLEPYYSGQSKETLQRIEATMRPIAERHELVKRLLAGRGEA